jgi:hypothetical protein
LLKRLKYHGSAIVPSSTLIDGCRRLQDEVAPRLLRGRVGERGLAEEQRIRVPKRANRLVRNAADQLAPYAATSLPITIMLDNYRQKTD